MAETQAQNVAVIAALTSASANIAALSAQVQDLIANGATGQQLSDLADALNATQAAVDATLNPPVAPPPAESPVVPPVEPPVEPVAEGAAFKGTPGGDLPTPNPDTDPDYVGPDGPLTPPKP
jgi:hypothetical protein